jgi:hypothetical protein
MTGTDSDTVEIVTSAVPPSAHRTLQIQDLAYLQTWICNRINGPKWNKKQNPVVQY